jgi:SPP1 gp7 family putative phage head morphogenesis protein
VWTGTPTRDAIKQLRLQLDGDDDEAEALLLRAVGDAAVPKLDRALREWLREIFPPGTTEAEIGDWERRLLNGGATFRDVLERTLIDSTDLGVTVALDQLEGAGIAFDWTLVNARAREVARNQIGMLIQRINETTLATVREATSRWIQNGEPLSALVRDLRNTGFSSRRAKLIAATETTNAFNVGNLQTYRESGVVAMEEWRTAMDERTCPICASLNGKRVPLGGWFDGRYRPSAHPGCRCWTVPVIDTTP